jgi:hypothetical protein
MCPQISESVLGPCLSEALKGHTVPLANEAELQNISEVLYSCMKESFLARYGGNVK